MDTWQTKLHPARFPNMSPQMAALVAPILGRDDLTQPAIAELCITADGFLMAREVGDCGFNSFIGAVSDWDRNWANLLNCAGLMGDELEQAERARQAVTTDCRRI